MVHACKCLRRSPKPTEMDPPTPDLTRDRHSVAQAKRSGEVAAKSGSATKLVESDPHACNVWMCAQEAVPDTLGSAEGINQVERTTQGQ